MMCSVPRAGQRCGVGSSMWQRRCPCFRGGGLQQVSVADGRLAMSWGVGRKRSAVWERMNVLGRMSLNALRWLASVTQMALGPHFEGLGPECKLVQGVEFRTTRSNVCAGWSEYFLTRMWGTLTRCKCGKTLVLWPHLGYRLCGWCW